MSETIKNELLIFALSQGAGVAAGVIFDFFRALRRCRGGHASVAASDIFFWLAEAALVFAAVYNFNSGQLRGYIFIGMAAGCGIYLLTLSRIMLFVFTHILRLFALTFKKTIALVLFLLKPFVFLSEKTLKVIKKIKIKGKKLQKQLKMY